MSQTLVQNSNKWVRFIDPHYKTILKVKDQSYVLFKGLLRKVVYHDDYHFSMDGWGYHICQFGELMERDNTSVYPINQEVAKQMLELDNMHGILRLPVMDNICVYFGIHSNINEAYIAATKDGVLFTHKLIPVYFDSTEQTARFYGDTLTIHSKYYLDTLSSDPLCERAFSYLCLDILKVLNEELM